MRKITKILLVLVGIGIGFIFSTYIVDQGKIQYGKEQYEKGYNQFQFDCYVPSPHIERTIPEKKRNSELKRKKYKK